MYLGVCHCVFWVPVFILLGIAVAQLTFEKTIIAVQSGAFGHSVNL